MSTQEQVFELLMQSGTNWTAEKRPTFDAMGNPSEYYGIFRKDTNKPIGAVGEGYVVMQNAELAEHVVEASRGVITDFTGGTFKGGKRIFYQGKLQEEFVGNDTVKRNITAMNSHDGSSSIGFGFANTVISCQNTFYRAMKEIQKFRHTATASERLELVRIEIQAALTAENEVIDNYKRMADTPVKLDTQKKVIAQLFNLEVEDLMKDADTVSPAKQNQMTLFAKIMQQEMAQKGETLWGLFNAVTYKTNHIDTKSGNKQKDVLEYVMVGAGADKNKKAYNTIVKSLPKMYSLS